MISRSRITCLCLVAILILVSGCGQKGAEKSGQSFGSIVVSTIEVSTTPIPSPSPSPKEVSAKEVSPATGIATANAAVSSVTTLQENSPTATTMPTVAPQHSPLVKPDQSKPITAVETPKATASSPAMEVNSATQTSTPTPTASPKAKLSQLSNEIKWTEFFDSEKQDTPSNKFWDMNGKTVQIKGFMGEVLSFDKHWFLLIPQPGAECPFDNGDETYWNKIMIVYVPDSIKLRYTSGPLLITGKLDVGIKLDESGYKTMFRLYDASFEKIKE
jgi:hypothetical protein